jgi:hypothetical protein
MKSKISLIIFLFLSEAAFCQTGINTTNPLQALHLAGTPSATTAVGTTGKFVVSPTMRVEGLNQTNNATHPASPAISTLPLYATSLGELVVGNRYTIIQQTLPGADILATEALLNVTSGVAGVTSPAPVYTKTFTLNQPSMVYFAAAISFNFKSPANGIIADYQAKMGGLQFSFSTAPGGSNVPTTGYFAANMSSFAQTSYSGAGTIPYGTFVFNLAKGIKLPAGTYTFNITVCGSAGTGNPFRLFYGGGFNDQVNITAISL